MEFRESKSAPVTIDGEVRWEHVARSRAVRRILERGITRWIEYNQLLATSPKLHYRAFLQREGDGHFVHCQIEVVAGERSWVGSRVGRGIQQALGDCLAHMTRKTPLSLSEPQPVTA